MITPFALHWSMQQMCLNLIGGTYSTAQKEL